MATDSFLKETRIGLQVGKLRKVPNAAVAALATEIVRKWKADLSAAGGSGGAGAGGATNSAGGATPTGRNGTAAAAASTTKPGMKDASTGTTGGRSGAAAAGATSAARAPRTVETDNVKTDVTDETVRNNCFKLLYNALASDSELETEALRKRALDIEAVCLETVGKGGTSKEYKQKMRSLYLNLKGNNVGLRHDAAAGDISARRLCAMSPEEMASEEKKRADERLQQMNIFNSLAATQTQASTDMFQCGKCKKRKCTYYQMQTRSADEPMTTFVTCVECGNKWKFS